MHRPDYVRAPKIQKPSVARVIVRAIRNGDPPGRFLRKDEKTGKWVDVGDKKAAEKTSQALREKTGEDKNQEGSSIVAPTQSPAPIVPKPVPAAAKAAEPDKSEAGEKKKDEESAVNASEEGKDSLKDVKATADAKASFDAVEV